MKVTMTAKILKTIEHDTREANLKAAKQSARKNRHAYLQRHTDLGADVIDVFQGGDVIERHICRTRVPYFQVCRRRPFNVEETAMYQ